MPTEMLYQLFYSQEHSVMIAKDKVIELWLLSIPLAKH